MDYRQLARQLASKYSIDPDIFERQIDAESGFNPGAQSSAGALGIAQFMPGTARSMGIDPTDPEASLDAAARLMAQYIQETGSWEGALAAYNAGPAWADYGDMPEETQNYINTILGSNARKEVSSGIQFTERPVRLLPTPTPTPFKPYSTPDKPSNGNYSGSPIAGALKNLRAYEARNPLQTDTPSPGTPANVGTYTPTGVYEEDINGYGKESEDSWNELTKYIQNSGKTLIVDPDTGMVVDITMQDADGNFPQKALDQYATKLAQKAQAADSALDRLIARRKAGLGANGQTAAQAYLTSEKEKAAEATRNYDDYVKRVGDLASLEDIPMKRAQTLASTLQTINSANNARQSSFQTKAYAPNIPTTNMQPFAQSIKSTLPPQAPQPYNIASAALQPQSGSGAAPVGAISQASPLITPGVAPPQGIPYNPLPPEVM